MLYREFVLRSADVWRLLVTFVKANAKACADDGKPLRIIVTQDEAKRTASANRRYWGYVLRTIAEQAWVEGRQFDADVWHEWYARKYGVCDDVVLPGGEIVIRRKSTTQMTVGEFNTYMQRVEADAATELGVEFQ